MYSLVHWKVAFALAKHFFWQIQNVIAVNRTTSNQEAQF
jgi:hypothetical protein